MTYSFPPSVASRKSTRRKAAQSRNNRVAHRLTQSAAIAAGVAALCLPSVVAKAQQGEAFTVIETGRSYARLQEAVDAIGYGQGSIAIAPGTYRECAVQEGGSIAYMAVQPGAVTFDGVTCEDKAALVLRGRDAKVSGLVFTRMAVSDYNGSGIRLQAGDLTVTQSWFKDSQQGILADEDPSSRIIIDKSTFSGLGNCDGDGGCAHSIYIGNYGHLRVTRSRFERGTGGHYLKARAARVDVASSSFDDSAGRETNYMIDLPAGSIGQITNNWFVQGQSKDNYSAFIAVGAEQKLHSSTGLQIAGNDARLAPNVRRNTNFVVDWSGERLDIGPNALGSGLQPFERR